MNNFMFDNMYAFYVILLLFVLFFVTAKIKDYESYFSSEMLNKIIIGKNKK